MFAIILGIALTAFTYGGLSERVSDQQPIPDWAEAMVLGVVFTLASLRRSWSIAPRWLLPFPSFLLYLSILTDRHPPMPFFVAFVFALFYALFITAYAAYAAEPLRQSSAAEPLRQSSAAAPRSSSLAEPPRSPSTAQQR